LKINIEKTSRRIKPKKTLVSTKETNKIVLCLLLLTTSVGLLAVCNIILIANNNKLASKRTVFVQQFNGATVKAQEMSQDYRSDEVIRYTVANLLPMMWEWDSKIPGTNIKDTGILLGEGAERFKVLTRVYLASYILVPRLRWDILKNIAKEIPTGVYQGHVRSVFEIQYLGKPIRKKDSYEINVIATRTDIDEMGQQKRESRFEKTLTLIAVEPYKSVDAESSPFRKQLETLLQGGLAVTSIKNIPLYD
jgi:hypothetical protein